MSDRYLTRDGALIYWSAATGWMQFAGQHGWVFIGIPEARIADMDHSIDSFCFVSVQGNA